MLRQRAGAVLVAMGTSRPQNDSAILSAAERHGLALRLAADGHLEQACDQLCMAIALDPASVMAHNNLGVLLHRLGRREDACEAYRAALAIDPDNGPAHSNLACVFSELDRPQDALDHARQAVEADPAQLGAYVYGAIALAHFGEIDEALVWLDRGWALGPHATPILLARVDLLHRFGRHAEAMEFCRQVIDLEPQNGQARNSLGLLHHALGDDQAAIAAFDQAVRDLPNPAKAQVNKAVVLLELGRREDAMTSLDHALALNPGLAQGWFVRADVKRFAPDDPDIATMEAALSAGGYNASDEILLRYALGKAYMDVADPPCAFAHLDAASALKRPAVRHDAAEAGRRMAQIAAAFTASLFAHPVGRGDPSPAPIFIIGMPRSGGTLVEQILASHPQVCGAGELTHVERLVTELGEAYPAQIAALAPDQIAALGRRYLSLAQPGAPGVQRMTDKAVDNFLHAGLIHLILPQARIIHCRRDPIDTCLSCYSKLFTSGQAFSYDLTELGLYYRDYARLMEHWRAVLPANRFIEVDYEAVVEDLEGQARRLLAFCNLDWDEACLRFHETARTVRTASLNQVRQPLYRTSLGRWAAFRKQLAPLLTALGVQA